MPVFSLLTLLTSLQVADSKPVRSLVKVFSFTDINGDSYGAIKEKSSEPFSVKETPRLFYADVRSTETN